MVTPLTYQKIQTSTGIVSIPIYNVADVAYSKLRVMTSKGLGAYDLVAISDTLPLRIMTPNGIKSFNTVLISEGSGQPPIVKDAFNRANSTTTLGTTETGQVWQSYGVSNVWGIQSNAAYPVTYVWDQPIYVDAGVSDNVALQIRINTFHSQQQIMWRIMDGNENYFIIQGNSVNSSVGGGYNNLGTISPGLVSGDVIRIEITGEKHVILVNNVPRLTFYNSLFISGTKFGFSTNSATSRFDDFLIEKPVPPNVPPTNITEDFLDDTYVFTYLQDPVYPWNRFNTASVDGNLGHIKSSQQAIGSSTSNITFDVHVPSGTTSSTLEVDWGVDSEANYDFLYLYVDGIEVLKVSGVQQKGTYTKVLSAGSHTLRVRYSKDGSADTGTDSAYISGIRLIHT